LFYPKLKYKVKETDS